MTYCGVVCSSIQYYGIQWTISLIDKITLSGKKRNNIPTIGINCRISNFGQVEIILISKLFFFVQICMKPFKVTYICKFLHINNNHFKCSDTKHVETAKFVKLMCWFLFTFKSVNILLIFIHGVALVQKYLHYLQWQHVFYCHTSRLVLFQLCPLRCTMVFFLHMLGSFYLS